MENYLLENRMKTLNMKNAFKCLKFENDYR